MSASQNQKAAILIVDDEPIVLNSLADWFRQDGHRVDTARNGEEALRSVARNHHDIALVDIKMPGMDGLELQKRLAVAKPDLTIIIMTAHSSVETAVKALKAGAYDYISKPFDPDELSLLIQRASEHRSLRSENILLKERLDTLAPRPDIVGVSHGIKRVLDLISLVCRTDATVLIRGESGTGKELVARAVVAQSHRCYGPMVAVNCGSLAESILESELFGHEKGAFTGAQQRRRGKFELADGGTVFLDEIGAVSQRVQVELLRVLEEKVITRLGGNMPIPVDFRIIAATNQDLEAMVKAGEFREDLYWRLNVLVIDIPPLRERPEDIAPLAGHFLDHYRRALSRKPMHFSSDALQALQAYSWPGNVRELQNAIERAVVVGTPPQLEPEDLPLRVTDAPQVRPGRGSLAEVERAHIRSVLESSRWNITRSARILEVDRGTLYNKIRAYGLKRTGVTGSSRRAGPRIYRSARFSSTA